MLWSMALKIIWFPYWREAGVHVCLKQTCGEVRESSTDTVWACPFLHSTTTAPVPLVFFQDETLLGRSLGAYTLGNKLTCISDLASKIHVSNFRFVFFYFSPLKSGDVLFSRLGSNTCISIQCLRVSSFSKGWEDCVNHIHLQSKTSHCGIQLVWAACF